MQSEKPFLVACLNLECGYENQIRVVKTVLGEQGSDVNFGLVEKEYQQRFMERFDIPGIPTYLIFQNGMEISRMLGEANREKMTRFINRALPPVQFARSIGEKRVSEKQKA